MDLAGGMGGGFPGAFPVHGMMMGANMMPGTTGQMMPPPPTHPPGEAQQQLLQLAESAFFNGSMFSIPSYDVLVSSVKSFFFMTFVRQYLYNDYFAGGLGLMLLGFIGGFFRKYWSLILQALTSRRGVVSVSVKQDEPAFQWLQEWVGEKAKQNTSQLTLTCRWDNDEDAMNNAYYDDGTGMGGQGGPGGGSAAQRPRVLYVPQLLEAQTIAFRGHKIIFQLKSKYGPPNRDEAAGGGGDLAALLRSAGGKEELVIEAPSREIIAALVDEAMNAFFKKDEEAKRTNIKRWTAQEFYWECIASKFARPMDSVILECDVSSLLQDANQFLRSKRWYSERGIPHRRGYLLHGPPGCGKTSLIQALAGELGLDVAMIGLSSKEMSDDMLHTALNRCDPNSIIILEDVDAAFTRDRTEGGEKRNSLSFSGLLNAIDGISAQEGRLLVMTTNHIERLDPALIRPGRVDLRLYLGLASKAQIKKIFHRFYPEATEEDGEKFAALVPENSISPASLQGFFLFHRDKAEEATAGVQAWLQEEEKNGKAAAEPRDAGERGSAGASSQSEASEGQSVGSVGSVEEEVKMVSLESSTIVEDVGEGGSEQETDGEDITSSENVEEMSERKKASKGLRRRKGCKLKVKAFV